MGGVEVSKVSNEGVKIISENLSGPEIKLIDKDTTVTETFDMHENVHTPLIEDFVRAVSGNTTPACDGAEGLKTNILLETIRNKK